MKCRAAHAAAVSIFAFAAACSPAERDADTAAAPEEGGALWTASSEALGPFTADTEFSETAIGAAAPAFAVDSETRSTEGSDYDVIVLRGAPGGGVLAEISGRYDGPEIGAVAMRVTGLAAGGPADIGDRFDATGLSPEDCTPGMEERSGDFICHAPDIPALSYWFEADYDGPDGELPPPAVMAQAMVYEVVWRPGTE